MDCIYCSVVDVGSCGLHSAQVLGSTKKEEDDSTRRVLLQEAKANASMPDFFPDRRKTNVHHAVSIIPCSYLWNKERKTSCYI